MNDQRNIWTTKDGHRILIPDLETNHLINIVNHLVRIALHNPRYTWHLYDDAWGDNRGYRELIYSNEYDSDQCSQAWWEFLLTMPEWDALRREIVSRLGGETAVLAVINSYLQENGYKERLNQLPYADSINGEPTA